MASTSAFVDKIDPFAKKSLKKKQRKSQGSSRYQAHSNVEIVPLPLLKGQSVALPASLSLSPSLPGFCSERLGHGEVRVICYLRREHTLSFC